MPYRNSQRASRGVCSRRREQVMDLLKEGDDEDMQRPSRKTWRRISRRKE
jgi:hypothetical protein